MASIYTVQNTLKTFLLDNTSVNTVTFGDLDDIDNDRVASYPLGHIDHEGTRVLDYIKEFDFTIYICEPLQESKTPDAFGALDNINFVYNTLDTVVEQLNYHLRLGSISDDLIRLVGSVSVELFKNRFEGQLTGYAVTFTVEVPKAYTNV